jgi:hypothetical protein
MVARDRQSCAPRCNTQKCKLQVSRKPDCGRFRSIEERMNTLTKWLVPAIAPSLPAMAFAQSNDAKYCQALIAKYNSYLNMGQNKGQQPQGLDARVAIEKCNTGDTAAGIPPLEKALKDAKLDLPSRS